MIMNMDESERIAAGKMKVLVMDDDKIIRMISIFLLNQLGYDAEAAVNGEEAISLYEKQKEAGTPYDAVILDIRVGGGMGGEETIRHLLRIDSGIKAIVSSGYHRDPLMLDYRRYGFRGTLQKPYGMDDVKKTLAGMLERTERPH
jgi:two-component system cell cycle sensor histidine kinase/response regulator CckA